MGRLRRDGAILLTILALGAGTASGQTPGNAGTADVSGPLGLVPDAFQQPGDGSDDAPSIQRAVAAACAGQSHILRFRARQYRLASAITQPCAVHWIGQGWQEPSGGTGLGQPGAGTWLMIAGPGYRPITITGQAAAGTVIEGFGIQQAHPAPGPGWAPTPYPYVFTITGTNGEVTLRHLMMLAVFDGIEAHYAGRLKIEDLRGQWFANAIDADKNFDTTILSDIRGWPYWSLDLNVLAYQQAHLDQIVLGRVDDTFADRLFAFGARSHLKLRTTPADPAQPAVVPAGSPTNLIIGAIRSDFTQWTLWNTALATAPDDVSVSISVLVHQGQMWPPTPVRTIPGSSAIRNDGVAPVMTIGQLRAYFVDRAMITGTSATGASTYLLGAVSLFADRPAAGTVYLHDPGAQPSDMRIALPPFIAAGPNTVLPQPAGAKGHTAWNAP